MKTTLNNITNFDPSLLVTVNDNNDTLETAVENTLSRDGTAPNQMEAVLDMNSNHIINLPSPVSQSSPLRLQDLTNFTDSGGGSLLTISAGTKISITGENPSVISTVGLENVDNTSDINKPVSSPQASALQAKSEILTSITDKGTSPGYIAIIGDGTVIPRTFTATDGLTVSQGNGVSGHTEYGIDAPTVRTTLSINNVDNTTDLNKPVSTATTTAISTAVTGAVREKLTANRTYYVSTTGNNSNNGLAVGTPFLTLQYAWDLICDTLDLRGFTVTIQLANGTYTGGLATNKGTVGGNGAASVQILGNSTPANVVISTTSADCIGIGTLLFGNSQFTIGGVKLQTTTGGNCINVSGGGSVVVFGISGFPVEFGACAQSHVVGNHGCSLFAGGAGNRISGSASVHGASLSNATVAFHGVPIICVGAANALSFPSGFWDCEGNGTLYIDNLTYTNGAAVNVVSPSGLVASGGKIINYPVTSTLVGTGTVTEIGLGKYLATGLENVKIADVTGLATGVATFLTTPTSANLATAVTNETGSGTLVFATSPTLVTPVLGAATATTINGVTLDNTAWSTYTPTITSGSGTATTVTASGRYKQIGKTVYVAVSITITAHGTAAGTVGISLPVPFQTAGSYSGITYEAGITGNTGAAFLSSFFSKITTSQYNGATWWVDGYQVNTSMTYEAS